jgi:hypothetical protein
MLRKAADFEAFERVMVESHERDATIRPEGRPRKTSQTPTDSTR